MSNVARPLFVLVGISSLALSLTGCPAGGSSSSADWHTATTYHVPEQVTASSSFTVDVGLTSGAAASGAITPGGVRNVKIADTSPPGAPIDCGDEKPVYVDGDSVQFTCTAPETMPSGSNLHSLAISVPESSDPPVDALVEVVNDGSVTDRLTDANGIPVTRAEPGQALKVVFDSSTSPAGVGTYTVEAPQGWAISGSDTCTLPTGSGASCNVQLAVPADPPIGITDYVKVTRTSGSSPLDNEYFPVALVASGTASLSAAAAASGLTFQYSENISQTVYANLPGQSPTFTYNVKHTFTNTSGGSLSIGSANIQGLSGVQYNCNGAISTSPGCTLADNGYFIVLGTLDNTLAADLSATDPKRSREVYVKLYDGGGTNMLAKHTDRVYLADYHSGYVAFRIRNPNKKRTIVAGFVGGTSLDFSDGGLGKFASTIDFQKYSYPLPSDGGLVYLPYGSGLKIYIAHTNNNFSIPAVPSVTAGPEEPPYVVLEATYTEKLPPLSNGQPACAWMPEVCPELTVDESYVNSMAILAKINAIGNAGHNDVFQHVMNTENVTFGAVTDATTKQLFTSVADRLNKLGGPWPGLVEYQTVNKKKSIKWIRAPISLSQVPGLDPFPADYYDNYIDKVWAYYTPSASAQNYMLVNASGVGDDQGKIRPADDCVVKGQVNAGGMLAFERYSGTCPNGYAVAGLPGMSSVNSCGHNKDKPCYDTPQIVFTKFNACDFLQATGSGECHQYVDPTSGNSNPQNVDAATFFDNQGLWGPNGTYRAVIGRAIAAYQAAGLLPPPSATDQAPSLPCMPPQVMLKTSAAAIVDAEVTGSGSLSSTPCLSGLSIPSYNAYASALLPYVDVYTYSYSDFLGRDGTVTFSEEAYDSDYAKTSVVPPLSRVQPVTVTLQ